MEWNGVGGTMSQLRDKILSYAVETYFPMDSAPSYTDPEILGTYLPTATPYMNNSGGSSVLPTLDTASYPPGGDTGSWRFDQPTSGNAKYTRMNPTVYGNQKIWDGLYGYGVWVKFNSFPVGTTTASYSFLQTGRVSGFPGFTLSLRGTTHTSGVGVMHNLFSNTVPIIASPQLNTWYYIVARKNRSTSGATIWVNGVKVATGSNTSGVEPVTASETPYQLAFGQSSAPSAAASYSYNLSHVHLMDFTTLTDAAIADIYTAGSTAPIANNLTYWDGTAWTVPTNKYQWDGINWITFNGKYWNGSAWTNIT